MIYLLWPFSSLFASTNDYLRFAIDWFMEFVALSFNALVVTMIGSLYSGLYLYINGMMTDMKTTICFSAFEASQKARWPIYVNEIDFHNKIIEYAQFLV